MTRFSPVRVFALSFTCWIAWNVVTVKAPTRVELCQSAIRQKFLPSQMPIVFGEAHPGQNNAFEPIETFDFQVDGETKGAYCVYDEQDHLVAADIEDVR